MDKGTGKREKFKLALGEKGTIKVCRISFVDFLPDILIQEAFLPGLSCLRQGNAFVMKRNLVKDCPGNGKKALGDIAEDFLLPIIIDIKDILSVEGQGAMGRIFPS